MIETSHLISTTLPNDVQVLIEPMPHTHSVSVACAIRVGARHEDAPISGISHLIEHMCFKGTRNYRTPKEISQVVERVGGYLNAVTNYETTTYYAKVPGEYFQHALHVLTDMMRFPLLEEHELEKERNVVIAEIRDDRDSPSDWVHYVLHESLMGKQPLGRDIAGTVKTVRNISHEALRGFWQQHYIPQGIVISIAGNIAPQRALDTVGTLFACEPGAPAPAAIPTSPAIPGPQVALEDRESEQGHFCFGLPSLAYHDPDRRALDVLDMVLGSNMSSRLFQVIREDQGLAYSVGSENNAYADAGVWTISGSVKRKKMAQSISSVLQILDDLYRNGITPEELSAAKEQVRGGLRLSLEDSMAVAMRNATHQHAYGNVHSVEQVIAEYEAVTHDDVQRIARRLLRADRLHLAVVGPYGKPEKERLRTLVSEWDPQ